MKNYGIPYMGSKQGIVASIAMALPKADHFYDLFGGGFSISHYMVKHKSHKYKHVHYNEIKSDVVELVKKAINGDYNYNCFKPHWISREEFFKKKDNDAYIRLIWSFGNNGTSYLFGEDIEPYKKSMHNAVVFDEFDSLAKEVLRFDKWPSKANTITLKRLYLRQLIEHYRKTKIPKVLDQFLNEKQLEQLERLQKLQRLELLQQLERLNFYSTSYENVPILENSVIYCDIPYEGTADYGSFDRAKFLNWAANNDNAVYISEYQINDDRFKLVYEIEKRSLLSPDKYVGNKSEKIYWNQKSVKT